MKLSMALPALLAGVALLSSCSTTTVVRAVQLDRLPFHGEAKAQLPPLAADTMRLHIYRPQALVGMWGSAIVIVDGQRMGDPSNPVVDNLLLPGTVFVVDTPARPTRVWWQQSGRGEEVDKAIELAPQASPRAYLRWELAPTYGYLRQVPEAEAAPALDALRFSGYVKLPVR
jgi:hypothetical protein